MNRREAVKSLGLGVGFLVATPSVISLFQSCTREPEFIPVFVNPLDAGPLREIVDLIIPSDDQIPGARVLGIHTFVDAFWKEMLEEEDQAYVNMALASLNTIFKETFNKEMSKGNSKEFDQLLTRYLRSSKEQQKAYSKKIARYMEAVEDGETAELDNDTATFGILEGIRGLTIWGWKLNEQIGTEVLWYDPIPTRYDGCIPAEEAGNGRVMSLKW